MKPNQTKANKAREKKAEKIKVENRKFEITYNYLLNQPNKSAKIRYRQAENLKKKHEQKISKIRESYNIRINDYLHPNSITKDLGKFELSKGFEKNFELKKPYDKNIIKFLSKKDLTNLRYILISVRINNIPIGIDLSELESEYKENFAPLFISESFTPESIKNIDGNIIQKIVNRYILKNSKESFISEHYKIMNVFIRLIYEGTKTDSTNKKGFKKRNRN